MPLRNPFKRLEELLKKIRILLHPGQGVPEGISLEELQSMIQKSENAIEIIKKGYVSIAYSSMTMDDVERLFGISKQPIPMDFPSWEIPIPQTLAEDLEHLDTVTDGSLENEALARARINIILQAVLKARKPFAPPQARTLLLGFETPMSITLSQMVVTSGEADYSLWYTSHNDRAHQLIVVEAKKARHVTSGLPQLLGYMGAVQVARRTAQKPNIAVFGVLTDAYQWDFVRLHNDGKYSLITFRWNAGQSQKIWDILNWMVACAEVQSPLGSEVS
ncbi:hypothetical protein BDV40DRAFT_297449 [Aspergillus tamarii]|uniref:Uncharacterized protein n=1 Tax=Aspergillus tamarii TaxID=41984 RepID=A0A5N6V464_ASPTM|nr:hypothetical protein BDV40DRAFT_297449 [Aspergillus tamarii]